MAIGQAWRQFSGGFRRIRGAGAVTSLMRYLPEAMRDEIEADLDATGTIVLAMQRADAAKRTGAMAAGLQKQFFRRRMAVRIGIINRPKLYYALIIEKGRKARTVKALRRGKRYDLRVRTMAPRPFVRSARAVKARNELGGRVNTYWQRVMARAERRT